MIRTCQFATMTSLGGVEKLLIDYFQSHPVTIKNNLISTSANSELIQLIKQSGVDVFQPNRMFRYDPSAIVQMASWLRTQNIKVLHSHNAYANSWGNISAWLAGIPVYIANEHGSVWWIKPPIKWLDQLAYRRARKIIANSKASAKMLIDTYHIPKDKIKVIYNAVPKYTKLDNLAINRYRDEFAIEPNQIVIGSVGRLDTPKDFFTFIDGAEIVYRKNKKVKFILVGGGPMEKELKEYVHRKNLGEQLIMTGWRNDAQQIISIFHIFVNTSIHESFGNVFIEAAMAGVPVIAPAVDGIPEVVIHNETGLLIKPTEPVRLPTSKGVTPLTKLVIRHDKLVPPASINSEVLACIILTLIDQPELRKQLGATAKHLARSKFDIERYSRELDETYHQCLNNEIVHI